MSVFSMRKTGVPGEKHEEASLNYFGNQMDIAPGTDYKMKIVLHKLHRDKILRNKTGLDRTGQIETRDTIRL